MTRTGLLGIVLMLLLASTCGPPPTEWRSVFEHEPWYRERSEPESQLRGVLQARVVPQSPNARIALRYTLDGLPVYAPGTSALEPYAGRAVVVRGKVVDLSAEGYGKELWPGAILADRHSGTAAPR